MPVLRVVGSWVCSKAWILRELAASTAATSSSMLCRQRKGHACAQEPWLLDAEQDM